MPALLEAYIAKASPEGVYLFMYYGHNIHFAMFAHMLAGRYAPARAQAENSTRASEAMRKAHRLGALDGAIVAIGNAPTALLETVRLAREEGARPALVIGVPVGFVSAAESKEAARELPVPFIVARGRKGGSPIAVAIIHALLLLSSAGEDGAKG